jgi:hypothetical protein
MLVTVVKGLVRALDENLAPLDQTGGGKASQGTEDNLLKKCGLHLSSKAARGVPFHRLVIVLVISRKIAESSKSTSFTKNPTRVCA